MYLQYALQESISKLLSKYDFKGIFQPKMISSESNSKLDKFGLSLVKLFD